jgi:hypothetical protein
MLTGLIQWVKTLFNKKVEEPKSTIEKGVEPVDFDKMISIRNTFSTGLESAPAQEPTLKETPKKKKTAKTSAKSKTTKKKKND